MTKQYQILIFIEGNTLWSKWLSEDTFLETWALMTKASDKNGKPLNKFSRFEFPIGDTDNKEYVSERCEVFYSAMLCYRAISRKAE